MPVAPPASRREGGDDASTSLRSSDYVDEVTPAPRDNASDWIVVINGVPCLKTADDFDEENGPKPLSVGDVVAFQWVERYGMAEMTIMRDGSFTVGNPIPPEVNTIWDSGYECLGDNPGDFAKNYAKEFMSGDDTETVIVMLARWAPRKESYRLTSGGSTWSFDLLATEPA